MKSAAVRLSFSLGMLGLLYWLTFAQKASGNAGAEVPAENLESLAASSSDHFKAGRFSDALAPTESLVGRYPTQHVYLERLAVIYRHLGRRRDEAAVWHRFMDASPTPLDACPAVADAHAAAGDPRGALAATEKCWKLTPGDPDAAFFFGRARERASNSADAAAMYRRALEIDGKHSDSQLGLARLDLMAGRLDAARSGALRVVERDPEHSDATVILALVAQRKGDTASAREYFTRTLTLAEGSVDAHIGLGIIEFSEKHLDASRKHFERALELDPSRRSEVAVWIERTRSIP